MNWAIFPSGNSDAAQVAADAWAAAGWRVGVLIDADQPEVKCDRLFRESNYRGTGAAFNRMLAELDWNIAACVNDDMFPVNCTPFSAVDAMMRRRASVIQPTGAWFDAMAWCAPCPIIARGFDPYGDGKPWHEGYYHLWTDAEIRDVAILLNTFADAPELGIEHRHKSLGFTDTLPPEKRRRNNEKHAADWELYQKRKAAGFYL